jgi:hypothetical protein
LLVTIGAFLAAWIFVAPWFGSFDSEVIRGVRRVWIVPLAWIATAPLGAVVRGLVLGIDVSPIFVVVMTVVTGAGLGLWRVALAAFAK